MLRLRQAVLAAADLDATAGALRSGLALGEPYNDPAVGYFGLQNAVFAIGDTFLEVVSPAQPDTAAGRYLERRGGDGGYMLMFQLDDVAAARGRAADLGIREVFDVDLDDITEAHLHPADMRGAIIAISAPDPPSSWRWGGDNWETRTVPGVIAGATIAVADPEAVTERWAGVLGRPAVDAGIEFAADPDEPGLVEVAIGGWPGREPREIGGIRFRFTD